MSNWYRAAGVWLPIATLPASGPVVLADETQTITWFVEQANADAVEHQEQKRDPDTGAFLTDESGPIMESSTVTPAFWCPAVVEA